jgi:hypothetical protein
MRKHALRSPHAIAIFVGRDRQLLRRLEATTGQHRIHHIVLSGRRAGERDFARALEISSRHLTTGQALFVYAITPGFRYEQVIRAKAPGFASGVRVFIISIGARRPPAYLQTQASVLWLSHRGSRSKTVVDRILQLWNEGEYLHSYRQFGADLAESLPGRKQVLVSLGVPNESFEQQRPFSPCPPPAPNLEQLVRTLTKAMLCHRRLYIEYRDMTGKVATYGVAPLLVGVSRDLTWRILAHWRLGFLCLKLDSILSIRPDPAPWNVPLPKPRRSGRHRENCLILVDTWAPFDEPSQRRPECDQA